MAVLETPATTGPKTTNQHPSDGRLEDTHAGQATKGHPGRASQPLPEGERAGRGPLRQLLHRHPRGEARVGAGEAGEQPRGEGGREREGPRRPSAGAAGRPPGAPFQGGPPEDA